MTTYTVLYRYTHNRKEVEDEYGWVTTVDSVRSIREFHDLTELDHWLEDMSVSCGEEGCDFQILCAFVGTIEDLKNNVCPRMFTAQELWRELNCIAEHKEGN